MVYHLLQLYIYIYISLLKQYDAKVAGYELEKSRIKNELRNIIPQYYYY